MEADNIIRYPVVARPLNSHVAPSLYDTLSAERDKMTKCRLSLKVIVKITKLIKFYHMIRSYNVTRGRAMNS